MTDVVRALTEAFGEEPSTPFEPGLGGGVRAHAYWSFAPNLEVVVGDADRLPSDAQALTAWRNRLGRRPIPLVLVIEANGSSLVVGPSGNPPPVVSVDPRLVVTDLADAARLDPHDVRARLPRVWEQARGAGGLSGLRNVGLFSTHYLRDRAPRLPGWADLENTGRAAARDRTLVGRIDALGFEHEQRAEGIYVLRAKGRPAAAVLSYPAGQDLDRAAGGGELPVAALLREMDAVGAEWGILASGDVWRLYAAEHPARTTSFLELDLSKLAEPAYYAALFSAQALQRDGTAKAIGDGSRDFAVALGSRLRDRIYLDVVPRLAGAVADELERLGDSPETRAQLEAVYDATLILLYRLLFVLYAEAREYLPVTASIGYREHSLRQRLDSINATVEAERDFDPRATDIWGDLQETFAAISNGHLEWGVPAYNGGLFHDDPETPAGQVLSRISPSNAGLGRALYHLAFDRGEEDAGRIDYSDLEIRHLGDIYEGLLQFEADKASEDLAYDAGSDSYIPAEGGAEVAVRAGDVYLRGRSGGRKASGSFYTPQIVVRQLVEEALVPVHDDHLAEVGKLLDQGDEDGASRLLFSFRVCDPAMGSGHFLVDALDMLTDRVAAFLSERPIKPVRSTLNQLREVVQTQARDLPIGVLAEIRDVELLKRVVLKRSIYGVDLNVMAVELAKLALWLDAFVPGLPLSFLDHNLKRGNSLVGVIGDEVLDALTPDQATIDDPWHIAESLGQATERAREAVERVELRLQDVEAAEEAERERRAALRDVEVLYDRWTAESFDLPGARGRISEHDTLEAANDEREAGKVAAEQHFFHWPLEFPEVFARDRAGFDVVLANPPWEKLMKEKHAIYALYAPGLRGITNATERNRVMDAMDAAGSPAKQVYQAAVAVYERVRPYFVSGSGNYTLGGGGHIDLFKAFGERFLRIVRHRGRVGAVLPRAILYAPSTKALRRAYLGDNTLQTVDVIENKGQWVFENVHAETSFGLYALEKGVPERKHVIEVSPLIRAEADLHKVRGARLRWPLERLEALSDDLEVPLLATEEEARIVELMFEHPHVGSRDEEWYAFPTIDFIIDRDWKTDTILNREGVGWPVWSGRNFDRYEIATSEEPAYWIAEDVARSVLQERRERSRLMKEAFPDSYLRDAKTLPIEGHRVFFRRTTNRNNSRSAIFCLAPPHVSGIEDAPVLMFVNAEPSDQLLALGVFNSLPFDWLVRRLIERKLGLKLLSRLPLPRPTDQQMCAEIARRVAALSFRDQRWEAIGRAYGIAEALDSGARQNVEAEIDALVARLFGLTRDQLEVMLGDFKPAVTSPEYREHLFSSFDESE